MGSELDQRQDAAYDGISTARLRTTMPEGASAPRRDRILAAAVQEFAVHGYAGARMERVAATAGVNKQLLFHYFASKDGLHRAAVSAILERYSFDVPASGPPADRLRDLIGQLLSATDSNPALLTLLAASSPTPSGPAESVGQVRDWGSRAFRAAAQVIQDGQRTGYVRDDVDPERVAEVLVAASLGWAAAGERGKRLPTTERGDQFREVLLKMVMDYCTWR